MINVPISIPNQPQLKATLDSIVGNGMGVLHTSVLPTAKTVPEGHAVIYDNGSGTKRIYVKTQKGNLGYITLT